ncbi:TrkH family potassium uptake protein [Rhodohalobacter sp. SW132]|uniref:TrkH family potassium uptake protein n=1 Tax=Rhodohalobacter sp. SW132 TaxID=2293433 RepID=UPI000E25A4F3|nr:TrkH family potassium uptake protein [Rhodohalobacter sp. SW132]REL33136.1 TrkH family potassium uptake protein [Rhodohalobacter sp. SW132]
MIDQLKQSKNRPRIDFKLVSGILGGLIFFLGFALLLPFLIALIYNEPSWEAFLITATGSMAAGSALYFIYRPVEELRMREAFLIVTLTWFIGSLIGALPFTLSGTLESYTDAVFETMSGLSTTGATILGGETPAGIINPAIEDLDNSLLFWRSLAHWLGGMGIIVLTLALLPLLGIGGMELFRAEYSGSTSDKLTPRIRETALLLWTVYLGMTAIQFLLLWLHPAMDWFDAINHAFSTLATGGFSNLNDSVGGFDSVYIDVVITIFMFLAGINFAMHFRLFTGDLKSFLGNREIRFYTLLTALFIVGVSGGLWLIDHYSFGDALRYGSFQVLAILTTTGFGTDDYALWMPFTSFLLFLLFFTGGCAGSTGGGIKMIRLLIIAKNVGREFKQIIHPHAVLPVRVGNRVIDSGILKTILGFFVVYFLIFLAGALIMSFMGYDFMSAMGASIACLGNIGPAWGDFGPTDEYAHVPILGKWVLLILMMIGRLELFTVLVIFTPWFWKN